MVTPCFIQIPEFDDLNLEHVRPGRPQFHRTRNVFYFQISRTHLFTLASPFLFPVETQFSNWLSPRYFGAHAKSCCPYLSTLSNVIFILSSLPFVSNSLLSLLRLSNSLLSLLRLSPPNTMIGNTLSERRILRNGTFRSVSPQRRYKPGYKRRQPSV